MNSYQWNTRDRKKVAGIHEVDTVTSLAAQVASLSKKLDVMASAKVVAITTYHGCGGGHASRDCPISIGGASTVEEVDFVSNGFRGQGQGNPYSNTYNPGWSNHPNFSWGNQGQSQGKSNAPPGFHGQQASNLESRVTGLECKMTDLEKALMRFISSSDARFQSVEAILRNHTASLHNLENQMWQIAKTLLERPQRSLPSNTEINPREQVKAITLRSCKEVE